MFNIPYMPTYPGLCQALTHCHLFNYGNGLLPESIMPVLEEGKRSFRQTSFHWVPQEARSYARINPGLSTSVSVSPTILLNSDRETESQPQTQLVSLSGKFAKDKGIKIFLCAVSLLFFVHKRQENSGLGAFQATVCQERFLRFPTVVTSLGRPMCFERGESYVLCPLHLKCSF